MRKLVVTVVDYFKTFLGDFVKPQKDIDIVFMMIEPTEWIVYIDDMPAISGQGSSPAEALRYLHKEIKQLGMSTGQPFSPRIRKVRYLKPSLPKRHQGR